MIVKDQQQTKPMDWRRAKECLQAFIDHEMWHELAICATGFYTGFRLVDYLSLTYHDFAGEHLVIKEEKTGKVRKIKVIKELHDYLELVRKKLKKKPSHHVFVRSRFRTDQPISRQAAITRVQNALEFCGIKHKQVGTHTLRKTFALRYYEIQRKRFGDYRALSMLSKQLNHANVEITRRYIGIEEQEHEDVFDSWEAEL